MAAVTVERIDRDLQRRAQGELSVLSNLLVEKSRGAADCGQLCEAAGAVAEVATLARTSDQRHSVRLISSATLMGNPALRVTDAPPDHRSCRTDC